MYFSLWMQCWLSGWIPLNQKVFSLIILLISFKSNHFPANYFFSPLTRKWICCALITVYGKKYLWLPNEEYVTKILSVSEDCSFLGMMGLLDCMHWGCKNCPLADHQQNSGKGKDPMVMEAVSTHNLWIWHSFFGLPGTLIDIKVRSYFWSVARWLGTWSQIQSERSQIPARLSSHRRYLPQILNLAQPISEPQGKKKYFIKSHEAYRKDVKCAFGVLQAWYAIVCFPGRLWEHAELCYIIKSVIIFHNMTVEGKMDTEYKNNHKYHQIPQTQALILTQELANNDFNAFILQYKSIHNIQTTKNRKTMW